MDSANSISPVPKSPRKTKTRRVRVHVHEDSHGASRFGVLLKEVLQQIPEEQAKTLMDAYMNGKAIVLAMAQSSRGSGCKTAFQCAIGDTHEANTPILSREFEIEGEDHARETVCLRGGLYPAKKVSGMKLPPMDGTVN